MNLDFKILNLHDRTLIKKADPSKFFPGVATVEYFHMTVGYTVLLFYFCFNPQSISVHFNLLKFRFYFKSFKPIYTKNFIIRNASFV